MRVRAPRRRRPAGGRPQARLGGLGASFAAALALVAAALLGGCGGQSRPDEAEGSPRPEDAAAAATGALEEVGSFRFESTVLRIRADLPDEPEQLASSAGAVDLGLEAGEMSLTLAIPELAGTASEFGEPVGLRWDAETLEIRLAGEGPRRVDRDDARADGGLIGRFPDEPGGLVTLLGLADGGEAIGREAVGGRQTTGYRFAVDRRAAGQAGVPAELSRALEEGNPALDVILEAWLDRTGLPRRLVYVVELEPVVDEASSREILPARTIRGTYDLSDFGTPVRVSLPPPDE